MLFWIITATLALPVTWWLYQLTNKWRLRRAAQRLGRALHISHAIFRSLDHVPQALISRDLRRGLVLLLHRHLEILKRLNPLHPHIANLEQRMRRLNQIPSGLANNRLRTKTARREAAVALEQLGEILKQADEQKLLDRKIGDLARAAAVFAERHIAVEGARQAAQDAENVRAFPTALSFAYKAQSLCRTLPPMVGKSLIEAVGADIARIQGKCQTGH